MKFTTKTFLFVVKTSFNKLPTLFDIRFENIVFFDSPKYFCSTIVACDYIYGKKYI